MYNTTTKEKGIKIWQKSTTEHLTSVTKNHGIKTSSRTQAPVNLLNTLSDTPSSWPCMIKLQTYREQPCAPLELWRIHCKTEQPFATFYCKVNELEVLPVCVYGQFNVLKRSITPTVTTLLHHTLFRGLIETYETLHKIKDKVVIYQKPGNDLLKEIHEAAFRTMGYNRNFTDYVDTTGELKRSIVVDYFAESEDYYLGTVHIHPSTGVTFQSCSLIILYFIW